MTLNEVDFEKQTWTIPPSRSKNGREHAVPLSEMAIQIIREQIASSERQAMRKKRTKPVCIFPAPRGRRASMGGAAAAKAIKKTEQRLRGTVTTVGVPPFTPHDLRRSAATHMEELGISPFIIGHVLNHVSATKASITSRIYARYTYEKEKRDALNWWADRLSNIIDGTAKANVVALAVAR
jgi:integrase